MSRLSCRPFQGEQEDSRSRPKPWPRGIDLVPDRRRVRSLERQEGGCKPTSVGCRSHCLRDTTRSALWASRCLVKNAEIITQSSRAEFSFKHFIHHGEVHGEPVELRISDCGLRIADCPDGEAVHQFRIRNRNRQSAIKGPPLCVPVVNRTSCRGRVKV